jgi:hypothetical protein
VNSRKTPDPFPLRESCAMPYCARLLCVRGMRSLGSTRLHTHAHTHTHKHTHTHTHAHRRDRAGTCDKTTAQAFMKASTLFEALTEVMRDEANDPKMLELDNYAKNKTAYILKCLREGTTPVPGPAAIGADDGPAQGGGAPPSGGAGGQHDDWGAQPPPQAASGGGGDWGAPPPSQKPPPPAAGGGGGWGSSSSGSGGGGGGGGGGSYIDDYGMPSAPSSKAPPPAASSFDHFDFGLPSVPSSQPSSSSSQPPYGGHAFSDLPPSAPPAPPAVKPPTAPQPAFVPSPQKAKTPPVAAPVAYGGAGSFHPKSSLSIEEEKEATKACKFAMSAMQHSDVSVPLHHHRHHHRHHHSRNSHHA